MWYWSCFKNRLWNQEIKPKANQHYLYKSDSLTNLNNLKQKLNVHFYHLIIRASCVDTELYCSSTDESILYSSRIFSHSLSRTLKLNLIYAIHNKSQTSLLYLYLSCLGIVTHMGKCCSSQWQTFFWFIKVLVPDLKRSTIRPLLTADPFFNKWKY